MKTITFDYEKKDGSKSERTLLVMVEPGGDKYAGVDLSELPPENAAQFAKLAQDLHKQYLSDLRKLQEAHELKYDYKQFLVSGMTNITTI